MEDREQGKERAGEGTAAAAAAEATTITATATTFTVLLLAANLAGEHGRGGLDLMESNGDGVDIAR